MAKKKVLIFTSFGGGGQISVTQALTDVLKPEYTVVAYNTFSSTFGGLDPLSIVTGGKRSFEDMYNFLLKRQWVFTLTNFLYPAGQLWYCYVQKKRATKLITELLQNEKPDVAISIIPFINHHIAQACESLNIPFILFPPDLDPTMYLDPAPKLCPGMQKVTYKNWYLTLPFKDAHLLRQAPIAAVADEKKRFVGYPLRAQFFETKSLDQIKSDFDLPKDKPVIMILLGSLGSPTQHHFVRALTTLAQPVHLVICVGKNEKARTNIEQISLPAHITKTIVGFTDRIADLMAVSDIFITKSGTLSVVESIYMNLPMILDATAPVLPWEKENHRFVELHNFGMRATSYEDAAEIAAQWLSNPEQLANIRTNMKQFQKKNGAMEMKKLIDQLIDQ